MTEEAIKMIEDDRDNSYYYLNPACEGVLKLDYDFAFEYSQMKEMTHSFANKLIIDLVSRATLTKKVEVIDFRVDIIFCGDDLEHNDSFFEFLEKHKKDITLVYQNGENIMDEIDFNSDTIREFEYKGNFIYLSYEILMECFEKENIDFVIDVQSYPRLKSYPIVKISFDSNKNFGEMNDNDDLGKKPYCLKPNDR